VLGREPTDDELAGVMARRLEFLPAAVRQSSGYRVLAGVEQALAGLTRDGYLLGLTTGGVEPAARIKLERAGLNGYFAFGGFGSDSPDRGELTRRAIERAAAVYGRRLEPGRCAVVGDTPLDIAAAREAGAVAVGVASGHFTVDQLRAAGAHHVLASLEEDLPL
jgi:phosphoglycolate phosphatase-like HAD superfamily hydrolase